MGKINILKSYLVTKLRTFGSRLELEEWQEQKVREMLKEVLPNSRYYRTLFQGLTDWKKFPTTDKKAMMDNFDDVNTRGIRKEDAFRIALSSEKTRKFNNTLEGITVGLSSGTSGNRGLFLANRNEIDNWTGYILAKMLPSNILHSQTIAFFLRANSNLYENIRNRRLDFNYFDLTKDLDLLMKDLENLRPTILVAPPSVLSIIAEKHLGINPRRVISVADVLEEQEKNRLALAFNQPVHQIYQATEGCIATTCKNGNLHLNEDIMVVQKEYLDERRFVPIITDFSRRTQPIIRYRLDDVLIEGDSCECGSVFTKIDSIEGRCDDVIYLQGRPLFPDFIRRAIITASPLIQDYNVSYDGKLSIRIKADSDVSNLVRESLKRTLREVGFDCPTISFINYQEHSLTAKRRRIINQER
jgi:putative adenylate-forming enzyme